MASLTIENYVKTIYQLASESGAGAVATGQIATALGVLPGTVTSMLKTLDDGKLATYVPYEGVKLTSAGRGLALRVLRRHRLIDESTPYWSCRCLYRPRSAHPLEVPYSADSSRRANLNYAAVVVPRRLNTNLRHRYTLSWRGSSCGGECLASSNRPGPRRSGRPCRRRGCSRGRKKFSPALFRHKL